MAHLQYLGLLVACMLATLPLEFAFQARVYRRIGRFARAMALPVLVFWAVDSFALVRHLWTYSRRYTLGMVVPHKLPIEELAFFVVIPLCAILTFEAANAVYSGRVVPPWSRAGTRPLEPAKAGPSTTEWSTSERQAPSKRPSTKNRWGRRPKYQGKHVAR